ncbi:MAG: hypothetical protein KAU52_00830, partial [Methanosarcinales archaeon]|nr:hypothetical protein [Methanosarcinales archaeon]
GSPSGVAGPPAAISPGYCCPDLFVIGRSCGCLRDSGIAGRFLGSDAAGVWWCVGESWRRGGRASVRSGQSISLQRRDVKILTDFIV